MAKIVLIGAGSHAFARTTISDILSYPELRDSTITLMDIAKEPLDLATALVRKIVEQNNFNTRVESTTDRREALEGADYVITSILVGGIEAMQHSQKVAQKYGVEGFCDAVGPSGVFGGLRHVPVILDVCHDMEELCPDALLINYTNPMAIISWAVNDYTHIKNVGLCHSVQHTTSELARYIGVPYKNPDLPEGTDPDFLLFNHQVHDEFNEVSCWVAGINHMAWFLEFKWRGKDAYPLLREKFKDTEIYSRPDAHWCGPDIVRAEIFKTFGYFVTESSEHIAGYVPYFMKTPELCERFKVGRRRFGEFGPRQKEQDENLRRQIRTNQKFPIIRSVEYGVTIIHSIETGKPSRINGNVRNSGLIPNLLEGCCVEVPCLVDNKGISPCFVGDLPPQVAALNRTNINVQELAVRGIVEKDKLKILQSILLDPLTGAILTIDETRQMVDEMFQAHKEYLKGFK